MCAALRALDVLVTFAVALALALGGAWATWALWDNGRVYAAASDVQADLLALKPSVEDVTEGAASFEELLAVNPDVRAWLTLEGAGIDHPVLQGDDNLTYLNTNVYGEFALAGSIYLDARCDGAFRGAYSLLYGHHMQNGSMFGNLELYRDESYACENALGSLVTPEGAWRLEVFACLVVPASRTEIFEPLLWRDDVEGLLDYVEGSAVYVRRDVVERARSTLLATGASPQVLAMSTCASDFTDARTVVLALMEPWEDPT